MDKMISEDFSFKIGQNISITETCKILKEFHSKFNEVKKLTLGIPIFLDTNILLNYYGMSKVDKESLSQFFKDKIHILYITKQIEKEFQRNRISTIQDYFQELDKIKNNFKNDLQEGVKNQFNNLLSSKIVQKDYPDLMAEIKKIYDQLNSNLFENKELENLVNSKIATSKEEQADLEYLDPILEIYKDFQITEELSQSEIDFLQKAYIENKKVYDETKPNVKWKCAFPGCGEKKVKEPFGDYIIFHEIMKFMEKNNTDAIFLTRDVTKSDWLQENRKQFIHYIELSYKLTGHLIFIFDATDLLSSIGSFENIYKTENIKNLKFSSKEEYHRFEYGLVVNSIYQYLKLVSDSKSNVIALDNRSFFDNDLDIVIENESGFKEGILIYNCGSSIKGYKGNVQKRVNACNKLIGLGLLDRASVFINLKYAPVLRNGTPKKNY